MPNPGWTPFAAVAANAVLLDSNGNIQQSQNAGTTGGTPPQWSTVLLSATGDGSVTWICVVVLEQASLPNIISGLPLPQFNTDAAALDPNLILQDMIAEFQQAANRTLYPAQVERLLINLYAYREALIRNRIQFTGEQNMLAFAVYPMIDYLGQLVGVTRLSAQPAGTILQFTLTQILNIEIVIPSGALVGTQDGQFQFSTESDLIIPAGQGSGTVAAFCTTPGPAANGYLAGAVSVPLVPNSIIASVSNTTITADGDNIETDDHLRTRIQAAPNRFSVAGPSGAYRFWALSADPGIADVQITTPVPGTVNVYVLFGPVLAQPADSPNMAGIPSDALLAKVAAVLNSESIRPLTDTVNVLAATEFNYGIVGTVTLYSDADPSVSGTAVNQAAVNFATALASRVKRDLVPSQIVGVLSDVPGVYEVVLSQPSFCAAVDGNWLNCTNITLTVVNGTEHS